MPLCFPYIIMFTGRKGIYERLRMLMRRRGNHHSIKAVIFQHGAIVFKDLAIGKTLQRPIPIRAVNVADSNDFAVFTSPSFGGEIRPSRTITDNPKPDPVTRPGYRSRYSESA